jgi:hypothetical protein
MPKPLQSDLERLRYWQGQKLCARDFSDQLSYQGQYRFWHNRALHNAYGVSFGLKVEPINSSGALSGVLVGCGVGYDCFGRELILQEPAQVDLPSPPGEPSSTASLVITYLDRGQFPNRTDISGVCYEPRRFRREHPQLMWELGSVSPADGVTLAELQYDANGTPMLAPGYLAPQARPAARPRIGTGATVAGGTQWELWSAEITLQASAVPALVNLGVQVAIDTSAAGFTTPPCYFATLQGALWTGAVGAASTPFGFFPAPLGHISNATTSGFLFRLLLPPIVRSRGNSSLGGRLANVLRVANAGFATQFFNFARKQNLYVSWLGIQPEEPDDSDHCRC